MYDTNSVVEIPNAIIKDPRPRRSLQQLAKTLEK